ncbi:AmmeMemoRadiSam system protein B, partial [Candidatus Bipolaricaulota bacterium]
PLDDLPRFAKDLTQTAFERQEHSPSNLLVVRSHRRYNASMNDRVRSPIVAGAFYPGRPEQLRRQIEGFLADETSRVQESLASSIGLIVPHAGYDYSGSVAAVGFQEVASHGKPEVVVILGASHTGIGPWFSLSPHAAWMTPLGRSPADTEVVSCLVSAGFRQAEAAFAREHSIEVQLPFIQHLWGTETPIVPICISPAPVYELQEAAAALIQALGNRKALIIASSDFTHYQPDDVARSLDNSALDRILALDVSGFQRLCRNERLTICGTGAIEVLMTVAGQMELSATHVVAYATSGDVTGDQTSVVGYASVLLSKENHG